MKQNISGKFRQNWVNWRHVTSWRIFPIFFHKMCWKSADVNKIGVRWVHKTLFSAKNYLIATKWGVNHFSMIKCSKVTAISVRDVISSKIMTSLLKSAEVSKIMTSYGIFWYFLKLLILLYNPGKFHPFPTIFVDFRQGGV